MDNNYNHKIPIKTIFSMAIQNEHNICILNMEKEYSNLLYSDNTNINSNTNILLISQNPNNLIIHNSE